MLFALFFACLVPVEGEDPVDPSTPLQTEACDAYVECASVIDPALFATVVDTFGPNGSCWDDPELAVTCDLSCSTGLESLRMFDGAWDDENCTFGAPDRYYLEGEWNLLYTSSTSSCTDIEAPSLTELNTDTVPLFLSGDGLQTLSFGVEGEETFDCELNGPVFVCEDGFEGTFVTPTMLRSTISIPLDGCSLEFMLEGNFVQ